jgi:hypothetical protein
MNPHGTTAPVESLSEEARMKFNAEYDQRTERKSGHEIGVPGFARLRAELSDEELAERIWRWHNQSQP